ncbi:ABC transporter ATP-binding protein [Ruminococcus flavefaciens]|uniref:ATP-binding cassette, subfamily B n=1 Tax=Ruminococcus flavefaciens TaxID=1265 RepID=A0A1M7HF35_RUMFL|nr:ABC transporter ATP-binding protein [Ruminococcus flavefaciens]SHM26973.1 ATP-binding cassette, subfamily B [Ruminococcus flavefaciens]
MKDLLKYLKNYKKELVLGPFFKLLEAIFELIVPVVMAKIIDNGIGRNDSAYIFKMSGLIVVLGVCGLAFALTCQYLAAKCAYGFGTELRAALYKHINSLSYSSIDRIGTASLVNRLTNDTNTVQNGVNMFIRLAVRAPFLVIGAAVMAVTIDLKLSLVFFVVAPLISLVIFFIMRKTVTMYKKTQKCLDRASMLTRENLEGARVIRAFSRQQEEIDEFKEAVNDISDCSVAVGKISAILNPVAFMVMNLGIVAVIWFGGGRIDCGKLTQGELTAFTNYMTQILLALVVLANLIVIFTKAFASANRISEIFALPPEEKGEITAINENSNNIIEFRNVSFAYETAGDYSIKNISFSVKRGQMLGIIGGTGCGKSTLANLIPCFYRATEGKIDIAGSDVNDIEPDELRKHIGTVPQRAVLFTGTIRDNMKWRKADATDDEIIAALKTAQAWEFVQRTSDGLDTVISQGGKNLSGGQKQRISIARALVGRPDIVILDDSTSALDYKTDLAFRKALSNDLPNTTVVMISQRTTSLRDADKIIVMDDGEAVGIGKHEELVNNCEVYREIYCSQMNQKEGEKNA